MVRKIDGPGSIGRRQIVPPALDARGPAEADGLQRVVPRRATLDARVPEHEDAEHQEKTDGYRQADGIGAAGECPDKATGRREKDNQPGTRDVDRSPHLRIAVYGVLPATLFVRNRHAPALRAEILSRQ